MSFPRYPKYKDSGVKWLGVAGYGRHLKVTIAHPRNGISTLWRLQAATPSES